LYDLNVTSQGRFNIYEFKFNGKKIVLKHVKLKSSIGNKKERTVTRKEQKDTLLLSN